MAGRRNIFLIVLIALVIGVFIQASRTYYLFGIITKNNSDTSLEAVKQVSLDTAPQNIVSNKSDNFLVLYDKNDQDSMDVEQNVCKTLDYLKKTYKRIDQTEDKIDYESFGTVFITTHDLSKVHDIDKLCEYVFNGGNVFITGYLETNDGFFSVYRKFGIYEVGGYAQMEGIKLKDNILIKGKGLEVKSERINNYGLHLRLTRECNIHAVTSQNDVLMWDTKYGKGKFLVYNGSKLGEKSYRGLLVGGISKLNEDFIYPIFNTKLVFIDDFPAPFSTGANNAIKAEYNRDIPGFFRDIWWPDMVKWAYENDVKYTCLVIEKYNDLVKPSFKDNSNETKKNLAIYGREILKSGGELGIHGYNHQSLVTEGEIESDLGYNPWPGEEFMIMALQEVDRYIKSVFPYYKSKVYVPPSNILGPIGREALVKALPDMKVISSLLTKSEEGDEYVQEFEIAEDGIAEIPRVTAGYEKTDESIWSSYNSITSTGVFSHFVHPDDVLDRERSGNKSWKELSKEYNAYLRNIKDNFEWLRPQTATQSIEGLKKYRSGSVKWLKSDKSMQIFCDGYAGEKYFILRTHKAVSELSNCKVRKIDDDVFLIKAIEPKFEVKMS
jgi:hypothetical protein